MLEQHPLGFGQWLIALDYALSHSHEIAIVGDPASPEARALLEVSRTGYRPRRTVALGAPSTEESPVPLLRDRAPIEGRATAYVCVRSFCHVPVTDPAALEELLSRSDPGDGDAADQIR